MSATARPTLIAACIATAMLMLDIAVVNTAIGRIGADLHVGVGALKWIVDAYALALATTVLTVGSLADRFGRRAIFAAGLVVFTLASLACALAQSIGVLEASRAVQGLGASALFAASLSLVAEAYPEPRRRAGAMAAYGATIGASFAVGPLVGGALTSGLGWRWIFLINLPIGAAALLVTLRSIQESRDPAARPIDVGGQATLTAGLFLLVLALLRANDDGWGATRTLVELGGAAVLLAAFVAIERRVRFPMLPLELFRSPAFTGAQLGAFAISGSYFAVYLYATLYLQGVLGLSPIQTGLVYLPGAVVIFGVSAASAQLVGRVAPRTMIGGGLALIGAGLLVLLIVGTHSSWLALQPGILLCSVGTGMFNPVVTAVALSAAPATMSGLASGVVDTARQAGIAEGVAGLGALVPTAVVQRHSAAYVDGMHHALGAAAALALAGVVACWWLIGRPGPAAQGGLITEPREAVPA